MSSDIDVWRAAHRLLKEHGKNAALVAAKNADEAMRAGDLDGLRLWKQIAEAMLELLRAKPDEGEHLEMITLTAISKITPLIVQGDFGAHSNDAYKH